MLSNRIWIMPQRNRASGDAIAEVLYRCGSSKGRLATHLSVDSTELDLEVATVEFVERQLVDYRALRRSKQKNPTRNLKKYFDRDDIRLIEESDADPSELARRLV